MDIQLITRSETISTCGRMVYGELTAVCNELPEGEESRVIEFLLNTGDLPCGGDKAWVEEAYDDIAANGERVIYAFYRAETLYSPELDLNFA